MNSVTFLEAHTIPYLHIFVRISGIFVFTPIYSVYEIPFKTKGWLTAGLALLIYPIVSPYIVPSSGFNAGLFISLLQDAIIGVMIGLIIAVYYTAFLLAGEFYSLQMGFGIINVIDPLSQSSIPILGQLKSLFAIMIFTAINGHHTIIETLCYSYKVLPSFGLDGARPLVGGMIIAVREMFTIAFQLASPIIGTIFLIELVMGIMSKIAPQMNVMVIGFQIKTITGLILLAFMIPAIVPVADKIFARSFIVIQGVFRWM